MVFDKRSLLNQIKWYLPTIQCPSGEQSHRFTASMRLRISSGRRSWNRVVFLALVWPSIGRQLDAGAGRNGQTVGGGIMLTRRLFGFEPRAKGELVRAEGLEPSRALRPNGFSCHYGFRRRPPLSQWSLGAGLSLHRARIWRRGQVLPV
jgi:hypothetical protein